MENLVSIFGVVSIIEWDLLGLPFLSLLVMGFVLYRNPGGGKLVDHLAIAFISILTLVNFLIAHDLIRMERKIWQKGAPHAYFSSTSFERFCQHDGIDLRYTVAFLLPFFLLLIMYFRREKRLLLK